MSASPLNHSLSPLNQGALAAAVSAEFARARTLPAEAGTP
jgi:hypothetical protein